MKNQKRRMRHAKSRKDFVQSSQEVQTLCRSRGRSRKSNSRKSSSRKSSSRRSSCSTKLVLVFIEIKKPLTRDAIPQQLKEVLIALWQCRKRALV